ncbi:MAG: RNA 2',3'-cyclic phosphodiesterase [Clostridiaceae bacterium]|nr:RNA 2',3'-cyclic phosphodiesterase [Clostridiaceae bacterium]
MAKNKTCIFINGLFNNYMRCFIAIEFDKNTRNFLAKIQDELRNTGVRGNYTRVENLHLTIKFLGEIDMSVFNDVCDLIKKVSIRYKKFVLELDKLGKFDKGNKSIVWAGISENKYLINLFNDIESGLENIMPIKKENRYTPHITLVREAILQPDSFGIEMSDKPGYSFEVPGISLMESTRINGRLTYIRRAFESFAV